MKTSESIKNLMTALDKFQGEVPTLTKSANNPFFKSKYTPIEKILEVIRPILVKNDLVITQPPSNDCISTLLYHKTSGEYIEATLKLMTKDESPQALASAITYMRRYSILAILGIVTEDEDDDGNKAQGLAKKPVSKKYVLGSEPSVVDSEDLAF